MSLAGRLEDVPVSDVMQFIHLGRRTGTLRVNTPERKARVLFHGGAIVGAHLVPGEKVGELLVTMGTLSPESRDRALARQAADLQARTLGQILLDEGTLDLEDVRSAVRLQVERTIYEVVSWSIGAFEFELDRMEPIDEISFLPAELLPELDLNTQMILLEAARVFDETHKEDPAGSPPAAPTNGSAPPSTSPTTSAGRSEIDGRRPPEPTVDELLVERPHGRADPTFPSSPPTPAVRRSELRLIPADGHLAEAIEAKLQSSDAAFELTTTEAAGQADAGSLPIIAFELCEPENSLEDLAGLCRRHPNLPVICVVDDVNSSTQAYAAGATAVVPADPDAVVGCFLSLSRFRSTSPVIDPSPERTAFEKLHRIVADLRSGLFSASVALSLMKVISESVERAVLFLVKGDSLTALGAFGFDHQGRPLADRTRGLQLDLEGENGLSRAIDEGRALTTTWSEASLPSGLVELIGQPAFEEVVIFPVLGVDRVILVVYTDNGHLDRRIEEVEILDLAAAEVGIAFENELLRRRLSERG